MEVKIADIRLGTRHRKDLGDLQPLADSIAEITGMLDRLREDFEQDLTADVPGTIRQRVNALLDDWGRRFGMTIPADARASLAAHVGRLVKEAVDALAPV